MKFHTLQLPVVQPLFLFTQRKLPLFKPRFLSKGSRFADRNSQVIKHSPGSTKAEVPVPSDSSSRVLTVLQLIITLFSKIFKLVGFKGFSNIPLVRHPSAFLFYSEQNPTLPHALSSPSKTFPWQATQRGFEAGASGLILQYAEHLQRLLPLARSPGPQHFPGGAPSIPGSAHENVLERLRRFTLCGEHRTTCC